MSDTDDSPPTGTQRHLIGLWSSMCALAVAGLVIALLVPFGSAGHFHYDESLSKLVALKKIRIGFAIEPPYAFTTATGEVTGESPEVARHVCQALGIEDIEWIQTTFDELLIELDSGRFDVVAAGMFITPTRSQFVAFSRPTFQVEAGLLVAAGNPHQICSIEDVLKSDHRRIAVIDGAVEQAHLLACGIPQRCLMVVPDALTGKASVESGLADALALSAITTRWMAKHSNGALDSIVPFASQQNAPSNVAYGGFAFRQSDRNLRLAWDQVLHRYLGSTDYLQTVAPFGLTPHEVPPSVTSSKVGHR